jgi:hypothetical protein
MSSPILALLLSMMIGVQSVCDYQPPNDYGPGGWTNCPAPQQPSHPTPYPDLNDKPERAPNPRSPSPSSGSYSGGGTPFIYHVEPKSEPLSPSQKLEVTYGNSLQESMPTLYEPRPFAPSESLTNLEEVTKYLVKQVQRRNEVREQIKSMDRYETRHEIVEYASESLRVAREYYLQEQIDLGKMFSNVSDELLDLATSLTPGISWGRDIYESISGKDLHSDEVLGPFSRSMAILGAVTIGFGSKGPVIARKGVYVFEKLATRFNRFKEASKFDEVRKIVQQKTLSQLKEVYAFFRKHKFWQERDDKFVSFSNAFMKDYKIGVLTEDMKAYRYYDPKFSQPRGQWLTRYHVKNPEMELALEHPGNYIPHEWTIPKGTEVMQGTIAPNFNGKPGGAWQIFVSDKDVLR